MFKLGSQLHVTITATVEHNDFSCVILWPIERFLFGCLDQHTV